MVLGSGGETLADTEDWGLRLFVGGMVLGLALMVFVVTFDSTSFYLDLFAPTPTGVMRPLAYVLDGGILLSFASTLAGVSLFSGSPAPAAASAAARTPREHARPSRHGRGRPSGSRSRASHGST